MRRSDSSKKILPSLQEGEVYLWILSFFFSLKILGFTIHVCIWRTHRSQAYMAPGESGPQGLCSYIGHHLSLPDEPSGPPTPTMKQAEEGKVQWWIPRLFSQVEERKKSCIILTYPKKIGGWKRANVGSCCPCPRITSSSGTEVLSPCTGLTLQGIKYDWCLGPTLQSCLVCLGWRCRRAGPSYLWPWSGVWPAEAVARSSPSSPSRKA